METNFFQSLTSLAENALWHLTIHVDNGNVVVSTMLTQSKERPQPSLLFKGTAEELDLGFFPSLQTPVQQIKELFVNQEAFEKSVKLAKKSTAEASQTKPKTESAPAPKADDGAEKKRKFEDAMKEIAELNSHCKYKEAMAILPKTEDYPDKKAELEKLLKELEWKSRQLSLL